LVDYNGLESSIGVSVLEQSLMDKMGRGGAKWIHDTYSASREYVTTLFMIDRMFSAIISRSELYVEMKDEE